MKPEEMETLVLEAKRILKIEAAALTERGQRRKLNEDAVYHRTGQSRTGQTVGLYLVCDGLGGHQAGEVASRLAIEAVSAEFSDLFFPGQGSGDDQTTYPNLPRKIRAAISKANIRIRQYGQSTLSEAANLGTTITMALIYDQMAYIANVGDSRTYAWRAGQLKQITEDHSWVAELVKLGLIKEQDIATHPQSNIILQALGMQERVEPDLSGWELRPGDKLLLCSDGLWKAFPDKAELALWLNSAAAPEELCRQLVSEANRRDGSDNISVVVVAADGFPEW